MRSRWVISKLYELLSVMPAVFLQGARQVGKLHSPNN